LSFLRYRYFIYSTLLTVLYLTAPFIFIFTNKNKYRGGDFGGLDASTINEPSITYADFNDKLKAGLVEFVEFLAPDGDVAYATVVVQAGGGSSTGSDASSKQRLRIGEGYPVEQHDGYSSPMFCVRAVKNAGVPYKFVVPALMKSSS
jgi:hypothetical protein